MTRPLTGFVRAFARPWGGLRWVVARYSAENILLLTAALPTTTRRVVTLRKVYDLPVPDIAARLGLSKRDVELHLATAARAYDRAFVQNPSARPVGGGVNHA